MPSLSQTWLGPLLLLACLLVSNGATEEVSENCSHMIGNGHLLFLQQLVSVWPCLPQLLPTGETEVGNRAKEGVVGRRVQPCRMWLVAPTSSTDVLLIDFLKVNDSDPTPTPNPEALSSSPAGKGQGGLLADYLG